MNYTHTYICICSHTHTFTHTHTHTLTLSQPHSAGVPLGNAPVRKLFHSIDDEGYHVPTHVSLKHFLIITVKLLLESSIGMCTELTPNV